MRLLSSLRAAAGALGLAGHGLLPSPSFSLENAWRRATWQRRSRIPGDPGKPGDKLGKLVAKRRLGLATLR